jgi:hypothetical protein
VCLKCDGTGDGGGVWDDELNRWHFYVCGSCLGTGRISDPDFDWDAYEASLT